MADHKALLHTFALLSLLVAHLAAGAAIHNDDQSAAMDDGRIAGGVTSAPKAFPYYVAVTVNEQHKCGGFLYNDRFIITAASCIADVPGLLPINVTVTVGAYSLIVPDPNEQYIPALSMKVHESYNAVTKLNDIALIQLGRPVVLDGVNAWFLRYDDVSDTDKTAIVMGWGATQDEGLPYASRLRTASQFILDVGTKCGGYSAADFDFRYMICAEARNNTETPNTPGGTPCVFDEGSPLVQEPGVAVGIMSKNAGCTPEDPVATPLEPTIYTRLTAYYAWLRTNAGQQPATTTTPAPGRR